MTFDDQLNKQNAGMHCKIREIGMELKVVGGMTMMMMMPYVRQPYHESRRDLKQDLLLAITIDRNESE